MTRTAIYPYLDGESEDDGPDHTKCHFDVSVDDFLGTDGHKFDAFAGDEVKSLVHVGDLVEPHLATVCVRIRKKSSSWCYQWHILFSVIKQAP